MMIYILIIVLLILALLSINLMFYKNKENELITKDIPKKLWEYKHRK